MCWRPTAWAWAFAGLMLLGGCESEVSREDLGTPVFDLSKVPGADKPYRLPEGAGPEAGKAPREADNGGV